MPKTVLPFLLYCRQATFTNNTAAIINPKNEQEKQTGKDMKVHIYAVDDHDH
jgi:hypothetical protein